MNILTRMVSVFKSKAEAGASYSLMDAALGKFLSTATSSSGKTVNQDTAMTLSAAWGCIRILTETLGALPWAVYEEDGKGNVKKLPDHPLSQVLVSSPNVDMTGVEFRETKVLNLVSSGNAYSYKEVNGAGQVSSLIPIDSASCEPKRRDDGEVYYRVLERGKWVEYPREKIWHVKGFGKGLVGLSPIGAAREAMGTALAVEDFGAKFFAQGGLPGGTITLDKWLTKDQRVIARENLNQLVGGLGNAHRFALFEGGMKPEPWAPMPLDDMQFLSLRKFSVQEICRFYRVPPHMVADLDRATFSNIEHMSQEFVMFTLMPYFTRFESSVSRWLIKPAERGRVFLRINFEGLLRADSQGRAEFISKMLQNGVMTRNEARAKENLNRSDDPGMDAYTVQVNLTPIDKLGEMADATIKNANKPAPQPAAAPPVAEDGDKGATTHINMVMPESMKHTIEQRVEVPNVADLAKAVKHSADQSRMSVSALIAAVEDLTTKTEKSMEHMQRMATADRVVVYDADGEPIGTRLVVH